MEVILENLRQHPSCPHGPCLMFERHSTKGVKTGRRFYACSACRNRSECNFFHWVDDPISEQKKKLFERIFEESKPPFTHEECIKRLASSLKLPQHKRKYCLTCSMLILPQDNMHGKHNLVENIDLNLLTQPTKIFQALEENKAQAQYFFSDKTIHFLVSQLKLHYSKLILIGAPKIQEYLASNPEESAGLQSLLLDIDPRYMQFFNKEQFCHYNLFNNHFFGGEDSKNRFKQFLVEGCDEKIALLLDPPFGGLAGAIAYTLKKINKWCRKMNNKIYCKDIPMFWFFPYFLEKKVTENMPNMVMLDYKVEYANHKKFGSKAGPKGSPVRIFTNTENLLVLPESEGYRFCKKCQRYTSQENKHCSKCNACTTKHGNTYKHCDSCQECVKSSYSHCVIHNKCTPPISHAQKDSTECSCSLPAVDHNSSDKCYKCFGYGHKRHNCPVLSRNSQTKKKKVRN